MIDLHDKKTLSLALGKRGRKPSPDSLTAAQRKQKQIDADFSAADLGEFHRLTFSGLVRLLSHPVHGCRAWSEIGTRKGFCKLL